MSSGGRGFAVDAALAHHEDAQRVVRDLRADIDRPRHPVERVEIFGEAFPIPFEALGERRAGDVLDRLHQVDEALAVLLADRSEADAAITEQDRRYAMPRRRRQHRVPGCLAVIVGMDIDPAGGDEQTVRLDLALAAAPALPPTAVSLPPSIAMSPVKASPPAPSRIVPPRITISCMVFAPKCPCCAESSMRPRSRFGNRRRHTTREGRHALRADRRSTLHREIDDDLVVTVDDQIV